MKLNRKEKKENRETGKIKGCLSTQSEAARIGVRNVQMVSIVVVNVGIDINISVMLPLLFPFFALFPSSKKTAIPPEFLSLPCSFLGHKYDIYLIPCILVAVK